jgi:hypothetical protein
MRKTLLGLIAATAIITSMSPAAIADTRHTRHAEAAAQASEAARSAYGSSYEERDPAALRWNSPVHAGNRTVAPDDPLSAVNGN